MHDYAIKNLANFERAIESKFWEFCVTEKRGARGDGR